MPDKFFSSAPPPATNRNFLINGNFDFWQRGTSTTVANAATGFLADRWYARNALGTNGVITYSRVTGESEGALYGAKVLITTAPTAAQTNGCELWQTLDNATSLLLYNKTASFQVKVKAYGNVTSVAVRFWRKTSESKINPDDGGTSGIGSEVVATVNTSGMTTVTLPAQALGTSMTTAGVIGVRVRINAVSSGNTYDLNNGFHIEQGTVDVASTITQFVRSAGTTAGELAACLRFYWRVTGQTEYLGTGYWDSTSSVRGAIRWPVPMRTTPTPTFSTSGFTAQRSTTSAVSSNSVSFLRTDTYGTFVTGSSTSSSGVAGEGTVIGVDAGGTFTADAEL